MNRPRLQELANRLGIVPEYVDQGGRTVLTSDVTREALLAVMGFEAPTEDAAIGWLDALDHEEREQILAPVRVVERDDPSANRVSIRLPEGVTAAEVRLTLTEESGQEWKLRQQLSASGTLAMPTRPPYGYHRLTAELRSSSGEWQAEQSLIVVPTMCVTPTMLLGPRKVMGVVANLYSQRREQDWGIGDFGTLMLLVEWAGARGAAFVGINPLHALFNRGWDVSPYSPVSRLFRNPIYIDVDAMPEMQHSGAAKEILNAPATRDALAASRAARLVDYEGVIALKQRVLRELHRTFRESGSARQREYEEFVRARDPELSLFASWMTIAEDSGIPDWRQWPGALRSPDSPAVAAFRAAHAERIDFHRWLQFVAEQQLAAVEERARAHGMTIGVYQDLAIGTNPGGSDTWSYPDLFLTGASVGAPPDPYSSTGQNWGLPPIHPRALRAQRYRYWIQLLRRAFEHSGALRIDHVMGLFRMFWIPDGGTGTDGAYVRFDASDLLGILALESVRHNALVVGEDLGIVPANVPPALEKWGLLSSKVLYWERDQDGFKAAERYPPLSLATVNTHDMPPVAGFWSERDIALREQVGLLNTPEEVRGEKNQRVVDKETLLRRLELSAPAHYEATGFPRKLTAAMHEFLGSTPAALVGESLDDLAGETEPVNVPGVGADKYPSWRRRSRMTMEEIGWSFAVDDAIRCAHRRGK